jgi:hypothetical protein
MGDGDNQIHAAIDRWEQARLIDGTVATTLREEVGRHAESSARRLSQYVLALTGAVVLVIAGGVFFDWAWPLLDDRARSASLAGIGFGVLVLGVRLESSTRWLPASLLMQTSGVALLLLSYIYSERVWPDQTAVGTLIGLASLATPIVLTARSMRRSVVMPAVHMAAGFAFLAVFLDRSTPLSGDAIVWALDLVLAGAILVMVRLLVRDPSGRAHPWALNAFTTSMAAGFALVSVTAFDTLSMSDAGYLPVDVWLFLCAGLTLWGIHRAPPGLRRGWFERLLACEVLARLWLGLLTVHQTFDGPPEAGLLVVGGVGVLAFQHADRHGMKEVMGAASLAFIAPVWWWAVDRGGALGGVLALLGTAGFLFWASGRKDQAVDGLPGHGAGE